MRGAAARFYLCICAFFCFSSLCCFFFSFFVFVLSISLAFFFFLSFVCFCFLFLSFAFPFALLCYFLFALFFLFLFFLFVGFFLCFDGSCILVSYIYNIINKISIISFVCARTHAHTHARQRRGKIRHKKGSAKNSTPFIFLK